MKDIVKYCDDAVKETGALINSTEASLKQNMEEKKNVKGVIFQNVETTKRTLKQRKLKKFNYTSITLWSVFLLDHPVRSSFHKSIDLAVYNRI